MQGSGSGWIFIDIFFSLPPPLLLPFLPEFGGQLGVVDGAVGSKVASRSIADCQSAMARMIAVGVRRMKKGGGGRWKEVEGGGGEAEGRRKGGGRGVGERVKLKFLLFEWLEGGVWKLRQIVTWGPGDGQLAYANNPTELKALNTN